MVLLTEFVTFPIVPTSEPPLYILYAVTPTASVEAVHVKFICALFITVAFKPAGMVGAVGPGGFRVVALAVALRAEQLATASHAETEYVYAVAGESPMSA